MNHYSEQKAAFTAMRAILEDCVINKRDIRISKLEIQIVSKYKIGFLSVRKFIIAFAQSQDLIIEGDTLRCNL